MVVGKDLYICSLSAATIEYASPSVCVYVPVYTITQVKVTERKFFSICHSVNCQVLYLSYGSW